MGIAWPWSQAIVVCASRRTAGYDMPALLASPDCEAAQAPCNGVRR